MSAAIFIVSLLASGLSSSVVGTMAGQVIMPDFVDWRIPLWLRRLITMVPTVIRGLGQRCDASAGREPGGAELCPPGAVDYPGAVYRHPRVMGRLANSPVVSALAITGTVVVLSINALLLVNLILPG